MSVLSLETVAQINAEIGKYPEGQKQSAVMSALRVVQTERGWVSKEAIEAVAAHLGMAPMAVYEVATFYNMYDLDPVGKYKITVCTNLPCALSGGVHAGEYLKDKLGIEFNETTPDGLFTLKEGECMGACGDAPVMLVNNIRMRCFMTPDEIDRLLGECK
ncbi:MAG: NADH-quinone oxidoreductase subunit NuoE [Candidatus Nitricoxidivorans perseverans]|uniref:NADH-quinone oxidoreductase subunit NuoE n=1 Tax=Candidatus Nitricoxidivorans perseverans TaxID=2975601 RepID=A0AA49FLJ1_9PROT|nr:MAG: NADH-quinone oxidoreductase subunit NuoE [Candidatus Nitricoxidivorans perseverans]